MALSDRLQTPPPSRAGSPCSVGTLLATLDSEDAHALTLMLGTSEERGWAAGDIYDVLIAEGHRVSYQQINRHRSGKCRCSR